MRMHSFAGLALGAFGTVVFACTNNASPPYPDTTTFCTAKAKAICQVAKLCLIDPSTCETYQDGQCNQSAQLAMKMSARVYDADNAKACLDAVNAAYGNNASSVDFTTLSAIQTTCERVFTGNAPSKSVCTSDYDCANNLLCSPAAPDSATLVCAAPTKVAANDFCLNPGSVCMENTYCAKQPSNGLWLCSPAVEQGGACGDAAPCVDSQRCVGGICQPRARSNERCNGDADCDPSAPYCDPALGFVCTSGMTFAGGAPDCEGLAGLTLPGGPADAGASAADAAGQ
jgi:hypothetical protein